MSLKIQRAPFAILDTTLPYYTSLRPENHNKGSKMDIIHKLINFRIAPD